MKRQHMAPLTMLLVLCPAFVMGQTSWERMATAPEGTASYIDIQFVDDATGYALGADAAGNGMCGVMRTVDGGRSWKSLATVAGSIFSRIHFLDGMNGFIAADARLLRTTDGGAHWSVAVDDGGIVGARCGVAFISPSVGFFAGRRIYRTDDGGASFHAVSDVGGEAITFVGQSAGYFIAQRVGGDPKLMIFRSGDGGRSWSRIFEKASDELAFGIDFSTERRGIYTSTAGVFRTVDGGETWVKVEEIATGGDRAEVTFAGSSVGYVHTLSGIWRTDDGGERWRSYFPGRDRDDLVTALRPMGDGVLYVAEYHPVGGASPAGLWKLRQDAPGDAAGGVTVTPNPFKGETRVRYRLEAPAIVSLDIFDPLGKLIASPLARAEQGTGERTVTIDGATLPAGVFVYRLTIGDRIHAGTIIRE